MLKDYAAFSLKSLRSRKLRSWLTMIGIFIGIAAVVSLIGLGEGLRLAITSQFGFLGPDVLSVQASGIAFAGPPGTAVANPLSDELAKKIEGINGVESAFNRYIESAPVEFNEDQDIGFTASVPQGENRKIFERMVNIKAAEGRLLKDGDGRKVLLGNDYTKDDEFGKRIHVGDKILIKKIPFEVVGIMEKKGSFIFDSVFLINEDTVIDVIGADREKVNIIAIKVKDQNQVANVKENVEKLLRKERGVDKGEEDFQVSTPQATLESVNQIILGIQIFIVLIASISIIVGAIGIANTMATSVLERRKEIGTMKAVGARNEHVFYQFFIEAGLLGLIGGLFGIALGVGISYLGTSAINEFLGSTTKPNFNFLIMLLTLIGSFAIGSLSGVIPAMNAAKENPVEALRE